jgi:hypothetical protein
MGVFLILMYLLSLALGYAAAFNGSTRALWESLQNNDMPCSFQLALNPPWERRLLYFTSSASTLGVGYGFWNYGFISGAGIAFCFIVASNISEMFLLHKMRSTFHLNIILKAVMQRHDDYLKSGDSEHAKSMAILIEKVELELYAMKVIESASMVPAYDGKLELLKADGAKADNYDNGSRTKSRK